MAINFEREDVITEAFVTALLSVIPNVARERLRWEGFQKEIHRIKKRKRHLKMGEEGALLRGVGLDDEKVIRTTLKLFADRATWLTEKEQEIVIDYAYKTGIGQKLTDSEMVRLLGVLLAIPFAEKRQDQTGWFTNFAYEYSMSFKSILQKFSEPSSYTKWQVPIARINDLLSKQEAEAFYKKADSAAGIRVAGEIIVKVIGIRTPPHVIFAKYNHRNIFCTRIAAIQLMLRLLLDYMKHIITCAESGVDISDAESDAVKLFEDTMPKIMHMRSHLKHEEEEIKKIREQFVTAVKKAHKRIGSDIKTMRRLYEDMKKAMDSMAGKTKKELSVGIDGHIPVYDAKKEKKFFANSEAEKALKIAAKFFGVVSDADIEELREVQSTERLVDSIHAIFGSWGMTLTDTHITPKTNLILSSSAEAKIRIADRILESGVTSERELYAKLEHEIIMIEENKAVCDEFKAFLRDEGAGELDDLGDTEKKRFLGFFFRRRFFSNPSDVHTYAHEGMRAYEHVLQRKADKDVQAL